MQDFAAIDFETANYARSSVCSVGVIIVRGGEVWISSTRLSSPNLSIIITGALRCMVSPLLTPTLRPSSPKYGHRLSRSYACLPMSRSG